MRAHLKPMDRDAMKLILCSLGLGFVFSIVSVAAERQHTPAPAARVAFERANELAKKKEQQADATVAAFIKAIEADPEFTAAHEGLKTFKYTLIERAEKNPSLDPLVKRITDTIQNKYRELEKKYTNSPGVTWGIVMQFYWVEDPRARPYLLKIVKLQPDNARVWFKLSADAEFRGDSKAAFEYMGKAAALEPQDPNYAFYYADKLYDFDRSKWEAAMWGITKRFPANDRGAQAVYWLGAQAKTDADRILIWERLQSLYPPEKFRWSANGMKDLFETYVRTEPPKALKLAQAMYARSRADVASAKEWENRLTHVRTLIAVNQYLASGRADQALAMLDKLSAERSVNSAMVGRLKAHVMASAGKPRQAYDSLLNQQAKAPDDETRSALQQYGRQLRKSDAQVDTDLRALLDAGARPAPRFTLQMYSSNNSVSLAKLKGKVILLTFWFPGCGPCRAEMPHFEKVMQQFSGNDDVVYLGINGMRDQDDYVLPFLKKTGFSFTALKGTDAVTGDNGYKVRSFPENFLIDPASRIVYSGFKADDADGERMVQRMIESLLTAKG